MSYLTNKQLIEAIKRNKECVLHSEEMNCNPKCQNCCFHNVDYFMIDVYNEILKILKEREN